MNIKKIWLTLLSVLGIIVFFLAITSGKVYAGGVISDGVYGDLSHKKTKKPTYSARTATQTQTLTPTITATSSPTSRQQKQQPHYRQIYQQRQKNLCQ